MTPYAQASVPWRWNLGIWSIPIVLEAFALYVNARDVGRAISVGHAVWLGVGGWLIWPLLTPVIVRLGQHWPLDRRKHWRFVVGHLLAAACVGVVATVVSGVVVHRGQLSNALLRAPMGSFLYVLVLGVSYLAINTRRLQERELAAERLSRELAEAQLDALRMQLQPHFIFNTLNAVGALVRDHAVDRADRALTRLSDVLRTTLRHGNRPRVSLRDEVTFIRNYLEIETLRFGDRLSVTYSIPDDVGDAPVPTFILQPLVENALKHGLMDLPDGGTIEIGAETRDTTLVLSVIDDGVGLPPDWEARVRRGVGLTNARARLAHMYGAAGRLTIEPRIDRTGACARVELPLENGA